MDKILAIIPARGGSKGLPGKNIIDIAGLPLIAHTIKCAALVPEITRVVVSTDDPKIAEVAQAWGGDNIVPFLRPKTLAEDDTPVWKAVQHTLQEMDCLAGLDGLPEGPYDYVVLLEATSPARLPEYVSGAISMLQEDTSNIFHGVHGVSKLEFNPVWNALTLHNDNKALSYLMPEGRAFTRRQEMPDFYKMDGSVHVWRANFVRSGVDSYQWGSYMGYVTDALRAISIDTFEDLQRAEHLLTVLTPVPWLLR